jgi:UTP--glucose-1-phosphate uridylyltransferase
MEITKVVIPAAGPSARFFPYGVMMPREMLPLLNRPAMHIIAEEAVQSELDKLIIITARGKECIADYFDSSILTPYKRELDKQGLLGPLDKLLRAAQFTYIRQSEPLGLGHAVWLARNCINKEFFAVALPDDIIVAKQPALSQLVRVARQEKASVIAVQEVPTECLSMYGIVGIKKTITPNLFQLSQVVEKPQAKDAPSSLAVVGRYVLSSKIFQSLDEMAAYEQTELELTDAISHMIQQGERVLAYKVQSTARYDTGTVIGYIKAVIGSALQDPDCGPAIRKFLADLDTTNSFLYNPAKIIEHNL